MTLCRCLQRHESFPREEGDLEHIDFLSASKYLRKVGLRVPDVRMKLTINRIIHFLTEEAAKDGTTGSFIHHIEREEGKPTPALEGTDYMNPSNKENLTDLNEPQSFAGIATSRSFLSEVNSNEYFLAPAPSAPTSLSKAFHFKQVVTKNTLEEQPVRHVRFGSSIKSQAEEEHDQIVQKLQQQNKNLEKCLKGIFNFFQQNSLISFEGSVKDLHRRQYGQIAEQLTSNFIDYTQDIQEKMANLSAKSSLLQETLHNMSISLRIDRASQDPLSKAVQTEEEEEGETVEQLRAELAAVSEGVKRAEIVLYLKEEEITSLKVIVSDLENKLKFYKTDDKPRSRSYKKFFQITGEDLSKSVR